jgi:hypothetical protein
MSVADEWCVSVFKCKPEQVKGAVPEFYRFVNSLEGVKSSHFLVRDRVDDEAVFSFRVIVDPRQKRVIKSKIAYKLGTLLSDDKFAVEPSSDGPLYSFAAWEPKRLISEVGSKKFDDLTKFLRDISKLTVKMIKKRLFRFKRKSRTHSRNSLDVRMHRIWHS